jgi:hypothetical protein
MKRRRVKLIDGDEYDALTRWRHLRFWHPGQRRSVKRKVNRRERRTQRDDVREQLDA